MYVIRRIDNTLASDVIHEGFVNGIRKCVIPREIGVIMYVDIGWDKKELFGATV